MGLVQGVTTSFREQLLAGQHDFTSGTGHTFKIALYTSAANLDATTTDYTTTGEVIGTGYTAGGASLTLNGITSQSGVTYVDFGDVTWAAATLTARGALIYNTTTNGGAGTTDAVAVLNFGINRTATAENFTVTFPAADPVNAIIKISGG